MTMEAQKLALRSYAPLHQFHRPFHKTEVEFRESMRDRDAAKMIFDNVLEKGFILKDQWLDQAAGRVVYEYSLVMYKQPLRAGQERLILGGTSGQS